MVIKKIERALEISETQPAPVDQGVNRPVQISAVGEVVGAIPMPAMRRTMGHFAESGQLFHDITELSAMRIPTISIVFGSSTAGGCVSAGDERTHLHPRQVEGVPRWSAAVKCTGEDSTDEEARRRAARNKSGLADYLAESEPERDPDGSRCRPAFELAQARTRPSYRPTIPF